MLRWFLQLLVSGGAIVLTIACHASHEATIDEVQHRIEKYRGSNGALIATRKALNRAPWYGLRKELRGMLAEQRPDLVAAHFAPYAFPVLDMLRSYPLVVHFHGPGALQTIGRMTCNFVIEPESFPVLANPFARRVYELRCQP